MGEKCTAAITPVVIESLAYQGVIVAFASYLAWFWLLARYLTARLGVLCGVIFLSEPLSATFACATLLAATGIVLVNLRR